MSIDSITTTITDWIGQDRSAEELDPVELNPDTQLLDAGIFDSLKLLQFVGWLEQHYGITVNLENLTPTAFATPGTIAELVDRLTEGAAG